MSHMTIFIKNIISAFTRTQLLQQAQQHMLLEENPLWNPFQNLKIMFGVSLVHCCIREQFMLRYFIMAKFSSLAGKHLTAGT